MICYKFSKIIEWKEGKNATTNTRNEKSFTEVES